MICFEFVFLLTGGEERRGRTSNVFTINFWLKSQLSILISIDLLEMTFQSWTKLIIKFWHHRSQYKFAILFPPPPSAPSPCLPYLKIITKEIASKQVRTWMEIIVLKCGLCAFIVLGVIGETSDLKIPRIFYPGNRKIEIENNSSC